VIYRLKFVTAALEEWKRTRALAFMVVGFLSIFSFRYEPEAGVI